MCDRVEVYRNDILSLSSFDYQKEISLINEAKNIGLKLEDNIFYMKNLFLEKDSIFYVFTHSKFYIFQHKSEDNNYLKCRIYKLEDINNIIYNKNRTDGIYNLEFSIGDRSFRFNSFDDTNEHWNLAYSEVIKTILMHLIK